MKNVIKFCIFKKPASIQEIAIYLMRMQCGNMTKYVDGSFYSVRMLLVEYGAFRTG